MTIRFRIDGEPMPQQRAIPRKGGGFRDADRCKRWKWWVALQAMPHAPRQPLDGPLVLSATFILQCPKSKTPGAVSFTTPDLKNLVWGLEDGLEGVLFVNDSRIARYRDVRKRYALAGELPGVEVVIEELGEEVT